MSSKRIRDILDGVTVQLQLPPLPVALLLLTLAGCGSDPVPRTPRSEAAEAGERTAVTRVRSSRSAGGYAHPVTLDTERMRSTLSSLYYLRQDGPGRFSRYATRVFSDHEAHELAPRLVEALSAASPTEEIRFEVVTAKGVWDHMIPHLTRGLIFARGRSLEFVFGEISIPLGGDRSPFTGDPRSRYEVPARRLTPRANQYLVRSGRFAHYNWIATRLPAQR